MQGAENSSTLLLQGQAGTTRAEAKSFERALPSFGSLRSDVWLRCAYLEIGHSFEVRASSDPEP
jgi:hypothetical protein